MGLDDHRVCERTWGTFEWDKARTSEENAVSPPPLSGFSSTQKKVVEGGFISQV